MERYLGGETIPAGELVVAMAKAMAMGKVVPILFTDARTEVGVKALASAIATYFPSPLVGKQRVGVRGEGEEPSRSHWSPRPTGRCGPRCSR